MLILFLLLVKEVEISNESKWPAASYWQTYGKRIENNSPWVGSEITTLKNQIASPRMASELKPFAGRYESNYHKIAATMNSIQIDTPDPLD
jgi:hypothetical protein